MKGAVSKKLGLMVLSVFLIFIISGCGTESDNSHNEITTPETVTYDEVETCGTCHNHTEGSGLYDDYRSSPHALSEYVFPLALCARCHTNEGAQAYIGYVNGTESISEMEDATAGLADIEDPSNMSCRTCHDKDAPTMLLGDKTIGLPAAWSSEFKTCTACHQLLDTDDTAISEIYHEHMGDEYKITDTHYDDPATPVRDARGTAHSGIEGYVLDPSNERVCRDCHNVHDADKTIQEDWAESAHGDLGGEPWIHYDWKPVTGGSSGTGRQDCQRCHTSTGFKNFAVDPALYNAANNVFAATGEQAEVLYCWACHKDNAGGLREPGSFSATAPYDEPASRITAVPDINGSEICLCCHSGNASGEDAIASSTADFTNTTFKNSHYLAAGGVLFRTAGYEYNGVSYDNAPYFEHDVIGYDASAAPNTGTNGPCVGCHMGSDEGHKFEVVKKDINGHITEIPANENICSNCHKLSEHGDYSITAADLNEEAEGYHASLDALANKLAGIGLPYLGSHPYFGNADRTPSDFTGGTLVNSVGKNNMGAAFNFNLLHHEPGGYAHNRYYTKRLIFDSIDWGFSNAAAWLCSSCGLTNVTRP
jgi:hypothetical protein